MSSAVTGKGVPVKVPSRSSRLSVLRLVRMAVAFVVVAGSLGLATVAATAQSSGGSCPSDGEMAYSDVPESSFAYDDSRCLRQLGISDAGDMYRPGDDMTRSEMAAFMANAYAVLTGMEAPVEEHMFEDVEGDPNADDIARISPNGLMITQGTSVTTYSPGDPVRRGHMALFLTRLYKAATGEDAPAGDTPFTDIGDRPDAEQAAIGSLFALGVTRGTSDTTYAPHGNVTREQMASFVARMYRAIDEMPDPAEAPGAPTGVEVAVSGDDGDALDVSWMAPEDSGTSDVSGYVVQWKSGGGDYSEDNQRSVDGMMSMFDGLTKGTAYMFRVAAMSDDGQSDWSDEASGTPGTVPGAVSNFAVAVGAASGTLNLSWAAPADDGGTPITGYVVQWATGRNAPDTAMINDGSATSYTITGLKTGVSYRVHIQAVNGAGDGAITAPADSGQAAVAPTTSVSSGTVRVVLPGPADTAFATGGVFKAVSWPTPTLGRGQNVLNYDIQRKCGKQTWPATHTDDGDRTDTQLPPEIAVAVQFAERSELLGGSLANGEECTYRVRANTYFDRATDGNTAKQQDADEPTLEGAWVTGTGTPLGAPGMPATVDAEVANGSLNVTWTAPMTTDTPPKVNDGGTAITGYKIAWASPATAPIGDTTVPATSSSYTITGLTNGLQYTVTIEAINARGASEAAGTTPAGRTPAAVPAAPSTIRVSQPPAPAPGQADNRGNVLIVTWSAPANNGTGTVTGYALQRRATVTSPTDPTPGVPGPVITDHAGTGTMYNAPILEEERGTSFDYRVRAINASGNGPWSAWASGIAAAALPGKVNVANIEIIPGSGSLTLTWTPAVGKGNDVTHYNVRYARNVQGIERWMSAGRVNASALPTKTITGLSNGVPYVVGITAVNAVGSSGEVETDGIDRPTHAMAAPRSVTAVPSATMNTDGRMIDVTWSAVANAVGYQVQYISTTSNPKGGWMTVDPTSITGAAVKQVGTDDLATFDAAKARKVTIGGLDEGTTYVVRVQAVTQGTVGGKSAGRALLGTPGFSAPVKAESTPATAPVITSFSQVDKTTTLRVAWTAPTNARTEGVTGYLVTWYPTATQVVGNRGSATVAADATSYDITGLTAFGQSITVTVAPVNKIGVGMATDGSDAVTLTPASS